MGHHHHHHSSGLVPRGSDGLELRKLGEISWEEEAEISGSSSRYDVALSEQGEFKLLSEDKVPWDQ